MLIFTYEMGICSCKARCISVYWTLLFELFWHLTATTVYVSLERLFSGYENELTFYVTIVIFDVRANEAR